MNSRYYGLVGKVLTKPLSTVSIELESSVAEQSNEVQIILDSQILQRVIFHPDSKATVHCTIDDSIASSNSKLQIYLAGCNAVQSVWIRSLAINGIDITLMLSQHIVQIDNPVTLLVDKPLWVWMVSNWNQILPDSYQLWHQLHKN